jgi:hypothetical protein
VGEELSMSDPNDPNNCNPCDGNGPPPTLCDGDITNNAWFTEGVCLLDTMSKQQIVYTIEHNPKARQDLARVTTCEPILQLLNDIPLLNTAQEDDAQQKRFNQSDCLPFYTIYKGNSNNR